METGVKEQKVVDSTAPAETKAPDKKLSKAEQRIVDKQIEINQRAARESSRVQGILCTKFLDFFITCEDPEGEAVRDMIRRCHAQWMVHCKRWNLIPENYHAVKKYCENIIHNYKKDKYDGEVPPEPESVEAPQPTEQK